MRLIPPVNFITGACVLGLVFGASSPLAEGLAKQPAPAVSADRPVPVKASQTVREASEKAAFSLKIRNTVSPYRITAIAVSAREAVDIEVLMTSPSANYRLTTETGSLQTLAENRWRWQPPEQPGLHALTVVDLASGQSSVINAFVTLPMAQIENGRLNGYRIGSYPDLRQVARKKHYQMPRGFVEVTAENKDVLVSPHFTLGQLLCKQQPRVWPKYVVLDTRLLLKLERILQEANKRWGNISTFTVMSGYRTPWYNHAIGNVPFSRHVFGDAADIFIDRDGNGRMDDLNGDGKSNYRDARMLGRLVEEMAGDPLYKPLIGGLGQYGARSHRGAFVHVDVRGYRARWNKP